MRNDFETPEYQRINAARAAAIEAWIVAGCLGRLEEEGLRPSALHGLLELGAGHGAFTELFCWHFEEVVATDAREELLHAIAERAPKARVMKLDLEVGLAGLPGVAVDGCVAALGVLYHLHPDRVVPLLEEIHAALRSGGVLLIDSIVAADPDAAPVLINEDRDVASASVHGTGCRFGWQWLRRTLLGLGYGEPLWLHVEHEDYQDGEGVRTRRILWACLVPASVSLEAALRAAGVDA